MCLQLGGHAFFLIFNPGFQCTLNCPVKLKKDDATFDA
tara:strand:+ start:466 stop:579 length:114 start_codon:yes stop_codon:yes gene_type:complete